MCTVSFIPLQNKIFIAHNRDEKSSRKKAISPNQYTVHGYTLLFPKDKDAGGTWIACNKNGSAAVLLNGAFEKHVPQPPYKKSRGLIFLDILAAHDSYIAFSKIDLNGIEPFTVILWSNNILFECRWDGKQKTIIQSDAFVAHTWSSVTLYDEVILSKRETWFRNWLQQNPRPGIDDVIQFHLSGGDGDMQNDLRMNRNNEMLTVSVTAIEINEDKSIMQYLDLQDDTRSIQELIFTKAAAIQ